LELLWYGLVVAFILGSAVYVELGYRTPRCHDCRTFAQILSRQIPESSPPVFEVVYCCPTCREILWKRLVSTISD
jgi:uncharacterized protein with PIN domain